MSHFTVLKTRIMDRDALVRALGELGFPEVEVHDTPKRLFGFEGLPRLETAEVIVRRKHIGRASNDLGFKKDRDGTYQAIISSFDRAKYGRAWLDRLSQRYAYHAAREKLAAQGFSLVEEDVRPNGEVHLVLRRMA
jgi:hypothetical protein